MPAPLGEASDCCARRGVLGAEAPFPVVHSDGEGSGTEQELRLPPHTHIS